MEVFYNSKFIDLLDSDRYMIAFKNGVYDLKTNTFREGLPTDYLSISLGVEYKDFTYNDQSVKNIEEFLLKVFPDTSVRTYFLHTSSDVFIGGNADKIVQFWTGDGDNAKSITEELFEKMLGSYAIKLPTSLLTGKRTQASSACPELARAGNGVRWAVLQEPEKTDVINVGLLKELSGNDTFFARRLHENGREVHPMF